MRARLRGRAQSLDERIKQQEEVAAKLREALEKQEREISDLKDQQLELKKDATAAADLRITTMGRGPADDPGFFAASGAAATLDAGWARG